jgi:Xaa-Pro aminopeptidase
VGIDAQQFSVAKLESSRKTLEENGLELVMVDNLIDRVWKTDRPALPAKGCWIHPLQLAGCSVPTKLEILRSEMRLKKCSAMVVSALDQVMWLFNIRGSDSMESPVLYSYAIVTFQEATLYAWNKPRLTDEVLATLKAEYVSVKDYKDFLADVQGVASAPHARVWASKTSTNSLVWSTLEKLGTV